MTTPSESKMTAVEQAEKIVTQYESGFLITRKKHIMVRRPGLVKLIFESLITAHATGYAEGRREERERCAKVAEKVCTDNIHGEPLACSARTAKAIREATNE